MSIPHVPFRWRPTSAEFNAIIDQVNDVVDGVKGDPGEPGGSLLSAYWTYNATTTSPPATGQIRTNAGLTTAWLHETDADGYTRSAGLDTINVGATLLVRASNGTSMDLTVTGTPTDAGAYRTIPISVITGSVTKGARTQVSISQVTPSPWTAIPLSTFTVANSATPMYRRLGDMVQLRGNIKDGTTGTVGATLPVGFRPPQAVEVVAFAYVGGWSYCAVTINVNGGISWSNSSTPTNISLWNIQYPVT